MSGAYTDWAGIADAAPYLKVNAGFASLGQALAFAHRPDADTGFVVGIGGGRYNGATYADATVTGVNGTNYIVANRSTGVLGVSTSTTDWTNTVTYGRVGIAVFSAGVLTAFHDERFSAGGLFNHSAAGVSASGVGITDGGGYYAATNVEDALQESAARVNALGLSGFRYRIELANTTASDPGPGLLKFNNATLASVTAFYLDDVTYDSVDLSALLASLGTSGLVRITSIADNSEWRVYKWTAAPTDNTGWWTFTVVDQAGTGTFEDDDEVQVLFLQLGASGVGGDVSAAANLTDNCVVRGDGGVKGVQTSGVQISDADELSAYLAKLNVQTGTSYTIDVAGSDTDAGKLIDHANAAAVTVTLPAAAPVGFPVTYVQAGAGQITFSPASGATLRNRQSHTKTAGQWAEVFLYVRTNAGGSAAEWVLGGDTAS